MVSTAGVQVDLQQRVDASQYAYFRRLAVVFVDPIRLKIVSELFLREMSPSQFHAAYGGGSLRQVAAHFRRLQEFGWLRLVRREGGRGRRGGVEHFYRAPKLAIFDNEAWAQLPRALRTEFSWRIFEQFAEKVKEAFQAGTFDTRPERHFTWTPLVLDEEGRTRVIEMVDALFDALFEEQSDASIRLKHSEEDPIHVTVGLAAFDSPRQKRNRSGLVLPAPDPDRLINENEFLSRLSKLFRNETNLAIVTELSLREMSPSQFVEECGGGELSEISRRFRALSKQGWIIKVGSKTGGKRRGATETFYRATGPAIFDTRNWAKVPTAIRTRYSWRIFEQLAEQVRQSMDAGTFDCRPDRHHTWTPFAFDELGWGQVIAAVDQVFHKVLEEQEKAKRRLSKTSEEPLIATVYLAVFESPPPPEGGP